MSKTALKKLLATLPPERKDELILDLYSARSEAREYLEFFLNPDIDALVASTKEKIAKAMTARRQRGGYLKPQITPIRALIKKVATLRPGDEYVVDLTLSPVRMSVELVGRGFHFSEAYCRSLGRFVADTVKIADGAGMLRPVLDDIEKLISRLPESIYRRSASMLRENLKAALGDALTDLGRGA